MSKITTTGELREFLASAINAVANGTMDTEKARNITKLAAQVNESFYSEIKIAKVQLEMGKESCSLGALPISGGE
ncbi:hypothetical protein [Ectopseudomonas hydrolytica]|uniref:hypothetical protein n=1 Tax=Ectopseudomonas hydrolytica TaxID=2493633 RepID=UPI00376F0E46